MNSYETIKNTSSTLYLDLKDESDIQKRLEDAVQEIHSQISSDFKDLFGHVLSLSDFHIFVDDETYRQSATGLILDETILNNGKFKIRIECLIDHGKIWIKVKEGKEIPDFSKIVKRIESAQNFEGLTELKEIK
ncbi:hypothetical protein [Winogradskyella psychrotolerans]|uniref:hypothetical protein n=1 Tax=Winogradskyella psychrotolerans TaxID=1344585 RepID=UPI001C0742E6|nr:hypothetical protein [Winogradskyella psychrotolerans]MBU2928851.1 hypothetical protein [Winogradskyella psychrotolerans]